MEKKIEIFYKNSLREIEKGLGNGITNSKELTEMGKCLLNDKYKARPVVRDGDSIHVDVGSKELDHQNFHLSAICRYPRRSADEL